MSEVSVTNEALALIGTRSQILSMTDGSTEALYANLLFDDLRDFLLAEGDYDFSLAGENAVAAVGQDPTPLWAFVYNYPASAIRIRQLVPTTYVPLDPLPVEWNLGNVINSKYIFTKTQISKIIFTRGAIVDDIWDPIFRQSFIRLLSSALAYALTQRVEASKDKLQEAITFAGIANLRDT